MPVGGVMQLPGEVAAMGIPPHWMTYISTPDCDASAAQVKAQGGSVLRAPDDIPDIGRFAVVADSQGAAFCIYTPGSPPGDLDGAPSPGGYSWHELSTTDPAGAVAFYTALAGWEQMGEFDMGGMGIYHLLGYGGAQRLGIMKKPDEVPVSNWLPYATVADADAAHATATAHGATTVVPPMEVPGGDRIAVMMDPQGAVFAVHAPKR
jgi:predicted enzyme related to lactoylglutathione lyase